MAFPSKGVVLIRPNGEIAFANTHFCKLVGISHRDIAGRSCFDFVFPEDLDAARQLLQADNHRQADRHSLRLKRLDGEPVWVDIQFIALRRGIAVSITVTAKGQVAKASG